MIKYTIPINFLCHIYSESVPDLANIKVAEAEDDYDTIIQYLFNLRLKIGEWIDELETERESSHE